MANVKKSVADGKGLVATAISAKGIATTGTDTFATMAGNVDKIITLGQGTGDGTAIANQILSGLVAYAKGKRLIGTMADNGAVNKSLAINGSYTVPPGYHNGLGKVTQSIATKAAQTYTPTTANQTIGAGQYLNGAQTIAGSGNLVPGNIKQGVNIFGVVGTIGRENSGSSRASGSGINWFFDITMPYEIRRARGAAYVGNENISGIGVTLNGIFSSSGYFMYFNYPNASDKKTIRCIITAGGGMSSSIDISWTVGD